MTRLRFGAFVSCVALIAAPASAAPPPPPPSYVSTVADLLTHKADSSTVSQLSNFVADDVRAYVNDKLIAHGKADWMRHYAPARRSLGRVLAYSAEWQENGSVMVVDEYDAVDRSKLPPNIIADPRITSRATLYQFGPDHKIHAIRAIVGGGFWIKR